MEITVRETNGVAIFDIQGRIIGSDSLQLKSIIDDYIASKAEGEVKVLLNFAKVPKMDQFGLCLIVTAYTSVRRKNGRIALLNLSRSARQLIVMAKLLTVFKIYDSENAAVASFGDCGPV